MKLKICVIFCVLFTILFSLFLFNNKYKKQKINLVVSIGIRHRKIDSLNEVAESVINLNKKNYTFSYKDSAIALITEDDEIILLRDKLKFNTKLDLPFEKKPYALDFFGDKLSVFYKTDNEGNGIINYEVKSNKISNKISLSSEVFRAKIINDSLLVEDISHNDTQFLKITNYNTNRQLFSVNISQVYNIIESHMLNQGHMIIFEEKIYYVSLKSSHVIQLDFRKLNYQLFKTIDSFNFPKVTYETSELNGVQMKEMVLSPNFNVNINVASDEDHIFILSGIIKDNSSGRMIDVYRKNNFTYQKTYFIPKNKNGDLPIQIAASKLDKKLAVLFSDRKTINFFNYN